MLVGKNILGRVKTRNLGSKTQVFLVNLTLRSLCEKGRARPPPELARLFALDKFIFWRVLAFWRNDRDLPHHITTREREPPQNEYFD